MPPILALPGQFAGLAEAKSLSTRGRNPEKPRKSLVKSTDWFGQRDQSKHPNFSQLSPGGIFWDAPITIPHLPRPLGTGRMGGRVWVREYSESFRWRAALILRSKIHPAPPSYHSPERPRRAARLGNPVLYPNRITRPVFTRSRLAQPSATQPPTPSASHHDQRSHGSSRTHTAAVVAALARRTGRAENGFRTGGGDHGLRRGERLLSTGRSRRRRAASRAQRLVDMDGFLVVQMDPAAMTFTPRAT